MKVHYKAKNNRFTVEFDGTEKEIFTELAKFQETFEEPCCGMCKSENIKYLVRDVEDNKFFEMQCLESGCRAKLSYGQHKGKDQTLFPKRKNEDGTYDNKTKGWHKYIPNKEVKGEKTEDGEDIFNDTNKKTTGTKGKTK